MTDLKPECILDAKAALGEGALWRQGILHWVDTINGQVHLYDPVSGEDRLISLGRQVGTVVPRTGGGLVVAMADGFALLDPKTGELTLMGDPEAHLPNSRFNDGKCGPAGRFYAGTMDLQCAPDAGALYVMDTSGEIRCVLDHVTISNGLAWSPDEKTLYYIDTPTHEVWAFDYDRTSGELANRRTVVCVDEQLGNPDGMTIDAEGALWVALWGGSAVSRWDPATGKLLAKIEIPALNITSCAFGGEDLDVLYVTTALAGTNEEMRKKYPLAGGLFRIQTGVQGLPAYTYNA